jgi:hypothetical protein
MIHLTYDRAGLDEIAGSIEQFMARVSGLEGADTGGVHPRAKEEKELFSDDDNSSEDAMEDEYVEESDQDSFSSDASGSRRLDEADGDVVINLDKLVSILERISPSASSNRRRPDASDGNESSSLPSNQKKGKRTKAASSSSIPTTFEAEHSSNNPNFESSMGTGSFLLDDPNDSDDTDSKSDSDDEDDDNGTFEDSYAVRP